MKTKRRVTQERVYDLVGSGLAFSQYLAEEWSFKKWLADTIFAATYHSPQERTLSH